MFVVTGLVAACSGASPSPKTESEADDPLAGMASQAETALASAPTLSGSTLTIKVAANETAHVSLRAADKAILVNGGVTLDAKGLPAGSSTGTAVKKIVIVEDTAHAGSKQVLLDYTNGVFATGAASSSGSCATSAATATAGIWLDAGPATEINALGIKGSSGNDNIVFGANGINMSANKCPDVSWQGAAATKGGLSTFVVSMGSGNDTWFAGGDAATGGVFDNSSPVDASGAKGVTIYGGSGNDTFLQGDSSHIAKYETMWGGGQSGDTVDYSARTGAVQVTVGAGTVAAASSDDGDWNGTASTEFDDINSDMLVVSGGSGNDILVALPSINVGTAQQVDYPVTFHGNAGNDTFRPGGGAYIMDGGAGNDTFDMGADQTTAATPAPIAHGAGSLLGGSGSDTVDFSGRLQYGVVIDLNGSYTYASGVVTWAAGTPVSGKAQSSGSATTAGTAASVAEGGSAGTGVRIGNDVENALGTDFADLINGNALDNKLTGYQGNDTLNGNAGDDTFDESISAAALALGTPAVDSGADVISGGAGTDTVDYSSRAASQGGVWVALDNVAHSGTFDTTGGSTNTSNQTFGASSDTPPYSTAACPAPTAHSEGDKVGLDVENANGGLGDDCLFGQPAGNAYCNTSTCANSLYGNDGDDMLFGNDDDDILQGGNPSSSGLSSEKNAIDCGAGQGNVAEDKGGGAGAYELSNCQFQF